MALIYAYKSLGITKDITVKDANGNAIVLGSNDKLRIQIKRQGNAAVLTVTSGTDTENGSSITPNSPASGKNRMRLDASDLSFDAGVYSLFVEYFDNADASEWKAVDRQVFVLEDG